MKLPRPHRRRVEVVIGDPLSPDTKASEMEKVIRDLLGENESAAKPHSQKAQVQLKEQEKAKAKKLKTALKKATLWWPLFFKKLRLSPSYFYRYFQ